MTRQRPSRDGDQDVDPDDFLESVRALDGAHSQTARDLQICIHQRVNGHCIAAPSHGVGAVSPTLLTGMCSV